ncbi:MAG: 4Fe-4S binding protein [Planctomycetes bacterium]|nr:4Fe-4S binding protein [Planctomycetota bacterium]
MSRLLFDRSGLDGGRRDRRALDTGERLRSTRDPTRGGTDVKRAKVEFRVGLGSCGVASGAEFVRAALENVCSHTHGAGSVKAVGCNGLCHREPLVEVFENGRRRALYGSLTPATARAIAKRHLRRFQIPWNGAPVTPLEPASLVSYLGRQERIVLENCGTIDPASFDEYRAAGGYEALERCVRELTPDEVVETIRASGLRGRGGAGFPTGRKWAIARSQTGTPRTVVCNGDEGDPGAFMDRLVLESDPHRVVEGLAIAAFATGASLGIFYVRAEYPLAVRRVRHALEQAERAGFLGANLLGSGFDLQMEVREGAGAFVCGEETALIASLEGRRGMPRLRPPYPVEKGFRDGPTTINNVETLACVPWILRHGHDAFNVYGTETSKGTKVFALAGKMKRGGLIEVPMGVTLREIVEEIGGGTPNGQPWKAVQIGGPSGGCLPASLGDTPVDYEALSRTGAIMGSGGLVVLDQQDCMVDMARFFLSFTQDESCGKCTFCRVGTRRMLEILDRICEGRGSERDLVDLEDLARNVRRSSLCGLGQTAPNPVLTTLRYFREEYEAHVHEKRCPGRRCPALVHYRVTRNCTGCTLCAQACPVEAIAYAPYRRHRVEDERCTRCGMCLAACQDEAIEVVSP